MPLREEFESTGNWLFRWRSYLPLVMVVLFFVSLYAYEFPGGSEYLAHMWEAVCLAVSFFGLAVRVFTIGHTPKGTSGRNTRQQVAETVNTTGIYSTVRHPLYVGNFFMILGLAMYPFLWWLVVIYVLSFWVYYERIMFAEEEFLRKKFGEQYESWASRTPAFIPRLGSYVKPNLPFSLRNVLRREYNGFFAIMLLMFALELAGDWVVTGKLAMQLHWQVLMATSIAIWAGLRLMKKFTKILNVDGR